MLKEVISINDASREMPYSSNVIEIHGERRRKMIEISIPGRDKICLVNLLLDYNGTLAVDGKLIPAVKTLLNQLGERLNIYIVTADTYGIAAAECVGLAVSLQTFPKENVGVEKKRILLALTGGCVAIGNGCNDVAMLEEAIFGIAVIGAEGAYGKLLGYADIVTNSIEDALNLLLNPKRIVATLRN